MENVEEVACKKVSTKLDWKNTAVLELNPETEYTVRIGDRGSRLYGDIYHFTTNAEEKEETKFLFMANSKQTTSGYDDDTAFAKTLDVATDYFTAEDMDFLVHGGDYTSSGMMPKYWAGMLDGYKEYAFDMPMVPVAGEMEYYTNTNKTTNVFENMFHIDAPSQTKTHGLYYSFNLGPAHVIVLNSNDCVDKHVKEQNTAGGLITGTGSLVDQQLNWLKDDLDYTRNVNSYIKWNIVVMHESLLLPAYANTDDKSLRANHAMSLREQLMSVLTEQKVDLVLSAQDGESFTTNPLVYDANNAIAIQPIAGQKAGETVYEQWIKTVETTSASKDYNGFNVLSFDEYQSGEMGTVFHQVGAIGLGKTSNFQYAQMAANLAKYGNIYNHLVSGIQNGKELSMFSNIELNQTTLTLRTYGVAMNEQYASLGELPYFGGIQLKK
jgi:phosphodiesterase/alkaline phosphatase D-like protein